MAGFCSGCGTAMADGVKFCPACGKTTGADPSAPVISAPQTTIAAPPTGNSPMKILFILLGIVALIFVLVIGSCVYIGYRVKNAANQMVSSGKPYTGKKEPCSFVTGAEVGEALGIAAQDGVPQGSSACEYVLGADGNQLLVHFTWQGGTGIMKMTHGALSQIGGANTFTDLPDIGDEAYIGPGGSAILMRKGDVMVNLDLRSAGLNAEGGKKIAGLIAARL